MALLAIAYPQLTPADDAWIEACRRFHDERFVDIVHAHFTFVFPTTGIDAAALEAHVRSTVARHAAFPFAIRGTKAVADAFSDDWHAFLVPEEGWAEVAALHDALYTGVLAPHLRSDMPFIPHVGIARSTSQERCEHLARELDAAGLDVRASLCPWTSSNSTTRASERSLRSPWGDPALVSQSGSARPSGGRTALSGQQPRLFQQPFDLAR